jgi:hypothetical protein
MRQCTYLLPVLLLYGCAETALRNVDSQSYSFDCNAPAGHFKEMSRTFAATGIRVEGFLELSESRDDPQWIPIANVRLVDPSGSEVGLKAFVLARAPTELQVMLDGPDALVKGTGVTSLNWKGSPVPFALSLWDSGEFGATIAGDTKTLALGSFAASELRLSCSTGHFHFAAKVVTENSLSTHDYAVGQVWTYHVREGDEGSTLQIDKIDKDPRRGTIAYISVLGVKVVNPRSSVAITEINVPVSIITLDKSVIALSPNRARPMNPVPGYASWKELFDSGRASFYNVGVAQIVAKAQERMSKPEQ